ncbi:hypothetical protein [Methanospirillum sp.]|uniref:hypothetical protein n=1 Tax=Methanospirillum sp. TaxID=45200 RepID=UPI0039C9CE9C
MAAVGEHALDLAKWLNRYGLTYTAKPYQGGTLFVLDKCPFSDAHADGAFAIQFAGGAIFTGCHNDSCGSGTQRWPELRARLKPTHRDPDKWFVKMRSERIRAKNEAEGRINTEEILMESSRIQERQLLKTDTDGRNNSTGSQGDETRTEALKILKTGDPLAFMLEMFGRRHEGDRQVA